VILTIAPTIATISIVVKDVMAAVAVWNNFTVQERKPIFRVLPAAGWLVLTTNFPK
jgi:hypothetical protein